MRTCTWKDCDEPAAVPQVDANGAVWAYLCVSHHRQLDSVLGKDSKLMVKYWILAQGGAAMAAKRMVKR